mgnify:CR=1 FL=1
MSEGKTAGEVIEEHILGMTYRTRCALEQKAEAAVERVVLRVLKEFLGRLTAGGVMGNELHKFVSKEQLSEALTHTSADQHKWGAEREDIYRTEAAQTAAQKADELQDKNEELLAVHRMYAKMANAAIRVVEEYDSPQNHPSGAAWAAAVWKAIEALRLCVTAAQRGGGDSTVDIARDCAKDMLRQLDATGDREAVTFRLKGESWYSLTVPTFREILQRALGLVKQA